MTESDSLLTKAIDDTRRTVQLNATSANEGTLNDGSKFDIVLGSYVGSTTDGYLITGNQIVNTDQARIVEKMEVIPLHKLYYMKF